MGRLTLLPMPAILILPGQLLGAAFACGLNLYLTVAVLGMAARLDLVAALPPGLRGLESGIIIGLAGVLYVIGFVADRIPGVDHLWEAVHTLIRPVAAGLLVGLALMGTPTYIQMGASLAAATMALAAHGAKAGIRMILTPCWIDPDGRLRPRSTLARSGVSLLEDLAAAAIAVTAFVLPTLAGFVLAAALLFLLLTGPRLWRAALLGLRAVIARGRGFFGRPGWRAREDLPRAIRRMLPPEPVGGQPARGLAAAIRGLPGAGAYRNGWLVFTPGGPRFVYSAGFRSRCAELPAVHRLELRRGILTDTLEFRPETGACVTLFLLKDGPPADLAAAELSGSTS
jgi:hypothetical protein